MWHVLCIPQGYMWKKGHVRRNWTERWFVLKPSSISYYVSEDLKEKKGEILLNKDCLVEVNQLYRAVVQAAVDIAFAWNTDQDS